jgi:enoyl-CoA hydratase
VRDAAKIRKIERSNATESVPKLTVRNDRALVQLNRPARRNCIGPADVAELQHILSEVEENESIRVLVLTGTGRTFCSGYDLVSLSAGESRARVKKSQYGVHAFADFVDRLENCRVPTICGLNGPAYGGGCDLALACDFRLGVRDSTIIVPAARLGVHYYHGGLRRFVTRLGLGASKRLLLLGQRIDAKEMLRIGYLDEVVATPEALEERIDVLADLLAGAPVPRVLFGMKRDLNRIANGDMDSTATDFAWKQSIESPGVGVAAAKHIRLRRRKRPTRN